MKRANKFSQRYFVVFVLLSFPIFIFLLWILVEVIYRLKIDVIGTREMWIGAISTVWAGTMTLLGVVYTIKNEREQVREEKRLDNLPILKYEVEKTSYHENYENPIWGNNILIIDKECYQNFIDVFELDKIYSVLKVSTMKNPVFNLRVTDVYVFDFLERRRNEILHRVGSTVTNENDAVRIFMAYNCYNETSIYKNMELERYCYIRVEFYDIYENKYTQDIFGEFDDSDSSEGGDMRQYFSILDVKMPQYVHGKEVSLEKTMKSYSEYGKKGFLENDI